MAQKKKKGGFFSGLGKAFDNLASDVDKAAKTVSNDLSNVGVNPVTHLKIGNIVMLTPKTCNKSMVVDADGMVYCSGDPIKVDNSHSHFEVVHSTLNTAAVKLRNVAYPQFYLAIANGFFVGNAQGGPECDFYGRYIPGMSNFCALESALMSNSFVGVLPTGQFTAPAQTSPATSDAAHFKIKFIRHKQALQSQAAQPPPAQGPPPQAYPPGQQQGYPPPPAGQQSYPPPAQQSGYPGPPPPQQQQQGYPPPAQQSGYPGPPPPQQQQKQGYPPPSAPPPAAGYPPPSAPGGYPPPSAP